MVFISWFLYLAKVEVALQSHPVRYGKVLRLVCSSGQYHKDWHWFKDNALLYRNNRPSHDIDANKYTEEIIDDYHRQLTIHDFKFDDIGQYFCSNGIFQDLIDLSQESGKFICKQKVILIAISRMPFNPSLYINN